MNSLGMDINTEATLVAGILMGIDLGLANEYITATPWAKLGILYHATTVIRMQLASPLRRDALLVLARSRSGVEAELL